MKCQVLCVLAAVVVLAVAPPPGGPRPGANGAGRPPRPEDKPSDEEIRAIVEEEFKKIDTDGSGGISKAEAIAAVEAEVAAGIEQVNAIVDEQFDSFDADGSGGLNQQELMAAFMGLEEGFDREVEKHAMRRKRQAGSMDEIFAEIDTDGDGSISKDELKAAINAHVSEMAEYAKEMCNEFFDEIDTDGNGELSVDEIIAGAEKMHEMIEAEFENELEDSSEEK